MHMGKIGRVSAAALVVLCTALLAGCAGADSQSSGLRTASNGDHAVWETCNSYADNFGARQSAAGSR